MLSKKMAFSLTSLITILALAFVVPSAVAQDEFDVEIHGPETVTYTVADGLTPLPLFYLIIDSPYALLNDPLLPGDFTIDAYDENGFSIAAPGLALTTIDDGAWPERTASMRRVGVTITPSVITEAVILFQLNSFTTPDLRVDATDMGNVSNAAVHTINLEMTVAGAPQVVSIQRLRPGTQPVVAAFQESAVSGPFDVRIVLTEAHPGLQDGANDAELRNDRILVEGGEPSNLVIGSPFRPVPTPGVLGATVVPHPIEGQYHYTAGTPGLAGVPPGADMALVPLPTDNGMYYQYQVTITPYARSEEVRVSLMAFDNGATPNRRFYVPTDVANKPNGREQLRLPVVQNTDPRAPGFELPLEGSLDTEDADIPEDGFYLLVRDKDNSGIDWSPEVDNAAGDLPKVESVAAKQTPAQLLYNVRESDMLPNLETFLVNYGTIELVAYGDRQGVNTTLMAGDIYISEIMWGSDAGLPTPENSQWIELATSGPARDIGDSNLSLHFYQAHETPPTNYVNEANGALGTVLDTVGARAADTGLGWSIIGKGQSGRTSVIGGIDVLAIAPRDRLISMYRTMEADGTPSDGTQADSWMQATGPAVNFQLPADGTHQGYHIGTPGSAEFDTPDEVKAAADADQAKADKAKADADKIAATGTIPTAGNIYISEVMFDGGGRLPQWIEIANGSTTEDINLSNWTLTVNNAAADADVSVGASATFTIPAGTMINRARQITSPSTILVATEAGRHDLGKGSGQIIVLNAKGSSTEVELILAGVTQRKYTLLSSDAFLITLAPPAGTPTKLAATATAAEKAAARSADAKDAQMRKEATDMAGNLGADGAAAWALPTSDEGRSSIIRKHINVRIGPSEPEDGMAMENWTLASDTAFADPTHIRTKTYYGAMNDVGTPGFRAGGALPVELSHFRPARQRDTGAVVITWSTQSELNNAGFFIKRSQQRDGEFKVVNTTMVAGAGTTSEKQFYTYTDTTAQPNVVYYYQIEDVSLDGNRQTLTRGIRLKGHVGAAGKATTLWGELKTSHE